MAANFGVFLDEAHNKLLTLYWLPELHKYPINHVLLLILVRVLPLPCLYFLTSGFQTI